MRLITMKLASAAAAASLIASPVAAASSTMAAPLAAQPQNSWVALSQMTPAGAQALASSGMTTAAPDAATIAAAAQVSSDDRDYRANPLPLPVIIVLLAVLGTAIYIAFIEKHHGHVVVGASPD